MPLGESMPPGTGTGLGMALSSNLADQVKREPHADQCCTRAAGLLQRALACFEERSCPSAAAEEKLTSKHDNSQSNVRQIGKLCA
jgi:hypothetical protein